jgi:hypothetical protein
MRYISFGSYRFNGKYIHLHVDDSEEKEGEKHPFIQFRFKPCQLRITGTDGNSLKYTHEQGGADGNNPGYSEYVHDCRITNIIKK